MPADVQRKASRLLPALGELLSPTMMDPSAETPHARLRIIAPCKAPSPTMPFVAVQRNASEWLPDAVEALNPTTTFPLLETPVAKLKKPLPGKSPRPTMPVPSVHRN